MGFKFNKHQEELVKEYQKILAYGYQKISSVELNFHKVRVRKTVLYFLMGAIQSYSESILKMMGSEPAFEQPGESLLRSQIETWMNMRFIYSSRSEEKARLFMSDILMESINYAKKHKKLWEKYPKWNLKFGHIEQPEDWDKFIQEQEKQLKKYRKKYGDKHVSKLPNLYDRALAIDKYLKSKGEFSEENSAEKYYVLFYKYFSQSTHLSMSGLSRYIRDMRDETRQSSFDIDKTPVACERVLGVSYQAYFTSLHFFLNKFGKYYGSEYDHFKKYSKSLNASK